LGFGTGICRVADSSPRKIRGVGAACGIAVVDSPTVPDALGAPVGIRVVAAADGGGVPPTRIRVVGAADGG
jgi:hypothetical protein